MLQKELGLEEGKAKPKTTKAKKDKGASGSKAPKSKKEPKSSKGNRTKGARATKPKGTRRQKGNGSGPAEPTEAPVAAESSKPKAKRTRKA